MPEGKLYLTFKLGRNCYKKYKYTSTYINILKYKVQQLATFSFSVTVFSTVKRIFALLMLPVEAVLHAVSFHMLQVHGCNTCNLYMQSIHACSVAEDFLRFPNTEKSCNCEATASIFN